ncbi:hypothetical protein D3C77_483610 [compost metagenome]
MSKEAEIKKTEERFLVNFHYDDGSEPPRGFTANWGFYGNADPTDEPGTEGMKVIRVEDSGWEFKIWGEPEKPEGSKAWFNVKRCRISGKLPQPVEFKDGKVDLFKHEGDFVESPSYKINFKDGNGKSFSVGGSFRFKA